jgi:UDP-N-acetylglucosamine 4,6-dehydratase
MMITMGSLEGLEHSRILITGGTGSLGRRLTRIILERTPSSIVVVYSRDEFKQFQMAGSFSPGQQDRLRFFLGDVRDEDRLRRALSGVQYVIHTAALKQVPAAEYNPFEFIKTNVLGAQNLINAAIDVGVRHVVALSTDKAANPINLYGATKLCSDKLFVAGNSYGMPRGTRFSVVRYGNVVGSRGSVGPLFLQQIKSGTITITDNAMTRFWITLEQGVRLVINSIESMKGGEIFVPKIPSMKVTDLADAIAPGSKRKIIGIRPGEKIHETLITEDEARHTQEFDTHYVIEPEFHFWHKDNLKNSKSLPGAFTYTSANNGWWLSKRELKGMIPQFSPEAQA